MRVVKTERDSPGLPQPNELTMMLGEDLPPSELVTAAFALAFDGTDMLFANLVARGLDLPGGHVESGESPEEAAVREVREETGARLADLLPLGCQRVRILAPAPADYSLPYPDSYMTFYVARIVELPGVEPDEETRGGVLLAPEAARQVPVIRGNPALYAAALAVAQRWTRSRSGKGT